MAFEVWRLSVVGTMLNQEIVNVFHYGKADGTPDGDPADLITEWHDNVETSYLLACPLAYTMLAVVARKVGSALQGVYSTSVNGSRMGVIDGPQLSPCITWATAFAERSARGRTYLPGVAEADSQSGILSSGLQTAMVNFGTAAIPAMVGGSTWLFSVHSYKFSTTRRINALRVNPIIRTQRRREIGVGA
jgi:hypothetical protein